MGNQLDLDVGSHGKLLDSHTRAALENGIIISSSLPHQISDPKWNESMGEIGQWLHTGLGSSKKVS